MDQWRSGNDLGYSGLLLAMVPPIAVSVTLEVVCYSLHWSSWFKDSVIYDIMGQLIGTN